MPFSSLFQPSLALSQFKSQLAGDGLQSRLLNLNFELARLIGFKAYEPLEKLHGVDMRIGEWLFAREAWGIDFGPDASAFSALCRNGEGVLGSSQYSPEWMDHARSRIVPEYLEEMCDRVYSEGVPEAVGFSCMFFQTIPSLALARHLKIRHSCVKTIFGGASFHSEMGEELISKTPWIDIVSTGEADHVISRLARSVLKGEPPSGLDGILYRDEMGRVQRGPEARVVSRKSFEALPIPDFDDFIDDAGDYAKEESAFKNAPIFLPFESSRGCFRGRKKQCAFCGLNAENMAYRSRSAGKTLEQIKTLAGRYPVKRFFAADNNIPPGYFRDFLPQAARCPSLKNATLFYEIRSDIGRKEIQALSGAGVTIIQPGIETLSTHILQCMKKGVTALDNIYLLKLCRIFCITPMWNFLIRVPGESAEDYKEMMELIPAIVHLHPPTGHVRMVQLHRFSPYFREKGTYVENMSAQGWYRGLFPDDRIDLMRVAYYFDADWKNTFGSGYECYTELVHVVESWISAWRTFGHLPGLSYDVLETGTLELADTRFGKQGLWKLDEEEALVYRFIDDPKSIKEIEELTAGCGMDRDRIRGMLDEFITNGLALKDSGKYLGLAIPEPVASIPLKIRRDIFKRFG
jgi:ribosomal peptide maturation radical SAM protein 1